MLALTDSPAVLRSFLGVHRSAGGRAWRSRLDAAGENAARAMSQRAGLPEMIGRVLAGRGVGIDEAEAYLSPSLRRDMPDPSTIVDMDRAAERLADAVCGGEPVAIFGDYDVDGACAAAILALVLEALGVSTRIHIPDRITEGYGPNAPAIDALVSDGARLIVTVDCGSASMDSLTHARDIGADVIVVDHHQVGTDLPPALAIVNPNRQDDRSRLGYLAGAGVVFLLAVALFRELRSRDWFDGGRPAPDLLGLVDLVALATVCDVVPLVGLNRAFVAKGLIALRRGERVGVSALAEAARLKGALDPGQLAFMIGPRINAGGRIGDAGLGARLLMTADPAEADRIAATLERLNAERQTLEADAVAEAFAEAEAEIGAGEGPPVLVCAREGWHPGIVGLIASRLKERFGRPAFAVSLNATGGTGSGRSISGVDLGAAVRRAVNAGIAEKGGGHAMAAGVTIARGRLGDLRAFLSEVLADRVAAARTDQALMIDAAITAAAADCGFIRMVERAGPYGSGNPTPVFAFPSHRVSYVDRAGDVHLRVGLWASAGGTLKAMAFRAVDSDLGRLLLKSRGMPLHVAGTLMIDRYNGAERPVLRILDAAVPERRA